MSGAWSALGALVLGGVGWLVAAFVGGPFRDFFDLRREVIHKSVLPTTCQQPNKNFRRLD
jgi:hypothetical protein